MRDFLPLTAPRSTVSAVLHTVLVNWVWSRVEDQQSTSWTLNGWTVRVYDLVDTVAVLHHDRPRVTVHDPDPGMLLALLRVMGAPVGVSS